MWWGNIPFGAKLYLAPPTAHAIEAAALRKAAEVCHELIRTASKTEHSANCLSIARDNILALIPQYRQQPDRREKMNASLIDLGQDHSCEFVEYQNDQFAGVNEYHKRPDGTDCQGFLTITGGAWHKEFNGEVTSWELISKDPITLSPSILCRACGSHGYIRNGKWEPA